MRLLEDKRPMCCQFHPDVPWTYTCKIDVHAKDRYIPPSQPAVLYRALYLCDECKTGFIGLIKKTYGIDAFGLPEIDGKVNK